MVKRFSKGKFYTLCLATIKGGDPYTFCVNVTFTCRYDGHLHFKGDELNYYVDPTSKVVYAEDFDGNYVDLGNLCYTNIIAGWQF